MRARLQIGENLLAQGRISLYQGWLYGHLPLFIVLTGVVFDNQALGPDLAAGSHIQIVYAYYRCSEHTPFGK
jgi:hypothetical protein